MLKMKKMNGLKIFALVLLSLSKFETMFGMKENKFDDEYLNKNYYLIDDLGNKITLDSGEDIKFKFCSKAEMKEMKFDSNTDILKISENGKKKTLVAIVSEKNKEKEEEEEKYLLPLFYKDKKVIIGRQEENEDKLALVSYAIAEKYKEKNNKDTICSRKVKKIGEDSINDDYILVDAENKKIEKIKYKNIVFKLLTRKKYLALKEKINNKEQFLKDKGKYILDESQNPLFFEEEEEENNNLILYVKRSKDNLCLAGLNLGETIINIDFNKDNFIEVHMVKKKDILVKDDSSKCCCGIC